LSRNIFKIAIWKALLVQQNFIKYFSKQNFYQMQTEQRQMSMDNFKNKTNVKQVKVMGNGGTLPANPVVTFMVSCACFLMQAKDTCMQLFDVMPTYVGL
jgi:hypothetical protein